MLLIHDCCLPMQVSGYIDYAHRLKTDPNMELYFDRSKRLMPRHTDMSFYNWETHLSTSNPTPNFQVCPGAGWQHGHQSHLICSASTQSQMHRPCSADTISSA